MRHSRFELPSTMILHDFVELERERLFPLHQDFLDEYDHNFESMQPRFAQRHDATSSIDKERFEYLLGIDVAHDTHPVSQWDIANRMIAYTPELRRTLSEEDRQLLLFAEVVHDFGEAVVKEDVAYGDKTAETEREELNGWDTAIATIAPPRLKEYLMTEVRPVVFDLNHPLHSLFDLSEKIGYVQSGILAAKYAFLNSGELTDEEREIMRSIAIDVHTRHHQIVDRKPASPVIDTLLRSSQAAWEQAALNA